MRALLAALCLLLGAASAAAAQRLEKIALWDNATGPHLRGAAIAQRLRDPEIDGPAAPGNGATVVPYRLGDLRRLAALGANVLAISHVGLFSERPPFRVDEVSQANLDRLIALAGEADLFVVIAFRSGPGRSPFTFHATEGGTWFPPDRFDDTVWSDPAAQEAWAAMWRHTAARYRDSPVVVGYQLMVEPNSSHVGADIRNGRLDIWDPRKFHTRYAGTRYDWNRLYPRLVAAVREVDPDTPILVGGNGYSSVPFLEWVEPVEDARTVYVAHNYAPWRYTSQGRSGRIAYPGMLDADEDGTPERIDAAWQERMIDRVRAFGERVRRPVAVAEFGTARWAPGAVRYLDDQMAAMEARGISHILWHWPSTHAPYEAEVNAHNHLFGPDPASTAEKPGTEAEAMLRRHWGRNRLRPSNVEF